MDARFCSDDIVRLAFDATSAGQLRQEILGRLVAATGAMGAVLANPAWPVRASEVVGLPVEGVERTRIPVWGTPPDISGFGPMLEALDRRRAVADTRVFSRQQRERLPAFHLVKQMGVDSGVFARFSMSAGSCNVLCLGFGPYQPANTEIESYVAELVPALALAVEAIPMKREAERAISFPRWLTERQREICLYVVHGYTNAEIAKACGISLYTVRNHLVKLFRTFAVGTRTELASRLLFLSEQDIEAQNAS